MRSGKWEEDGDRIIRLLSTIFFVFSILPSLPAQNKLNVTFRYIPKPGENFVRIFVPGTMPPGTSLDWGPNSNGFISPNAPSVMTFDSTIDAYKHPYELTIGMRYEYKFHFHFNQSGSDWQWISDPLNPDITGPYQNSVITVTDPFFFEPALHETPQGLIDGISVGIFTHKPITTIGYVVGTDTLDGTMNRNAEGVFYAAISPPRSAFEHYAITAVIDSQEYIIYDKPAIQIIEEPRPSETHFGVNLVPTGALFVVYAPGRKVMQILVAQSGRTVTLDDARVMKKARGETDVWWLELNLSPGEYEYEYLLPDGRRISDPFSRRVRNGKTVFQVGPGGISTADDYLWRSTDFIRPALDTLIIYELHVDDFAARGNAQGRFRDLMAKLAYLDSLGINAIELMPIMEFPGNRSWGYNTSHYAAVEATYGTPREFKELVDEAHLHGIAVILDIVWNHMDGSGPLWQLQPDFDWNPYFKRENDLRPHETQFGFGGVDFDHFTPETQTFVRAIHRIWVQEYHVDGFRFDFTRGIGWDLNQPQFGILGWSSALDSLDSTIYQIAEHFPADPYLIRVSPLDAGWNDSFHDQLVADIFGPQPTMFALSRLVLQLHEYNTTNPGYENRTQTVKATVTHDEQSLIQEMVRFKGVPLETALQRDLLYSTLTFTALGIPMIWQAQELGMQSGWDDDNHNGNWDEEKLAYRPVDWSLIQTERGKRHFDLYTRLITLRKRNPALYRGTFFDLWRYNDERVLVYGYRDETSLSKGDEVMAVANFSGQAHTLTQVPWLSTGTWKDALHPDSILTVSSTKLARYSIPAFTARIYFKGLGTRVSASGEPIPTHYQLTQNFPNPFNPTTTIEFSLPKSSFVNLKVYSILGREVAILVAGEISRGNHRIEWHANSFPAGIYFYQLKAGEFQKRRKMILLR